jgi:hypothetical protein
MRTLSCVSFVEKRRDVRFPARIVARVVRRNETVELLTNDVSFRGAFIRTDAPPALRQLVRVAFLLPEGAVVSGHAMVVHVVAPGTDANRVPGMGVQFWGPVDQGRAWEQFIHELKRKDRLGQLAAKASDKVRRSSERFKLSLDVILDGKQTKTRDISETGMAIRTDSAMPINTRVQLQVKAGVETITLDVVVRRWIDEPGFKGLGVDFTEVSVETRRSLIQLVRRNAPADEKPVFVPANDPKLH